MDGDRYLIFEVATTVLALPLQAVFRVAPMAELAEPPCRPPIVLGLLNLGGRAVPVLCLHRLLGLAGSETGLDSRLVVMHGALRLALAVDALHEIRTLDAAALRSVGERTLNDCVVHAFEHRGGTGYVLDQDRLLLAQERQRVAELQAMEQARQTAASGQPV